MELNKIYHGDALEVLKTFPDNFINMSITSPPYFNLRDYQIKKQIGLENTPEEYIDNLCNVFDEVKRVLRKDGTCWVNLGDSYAGSGKAGNNKNYQKKHKEFGKNLKHKSRFGKPTTNLKTKNKSQIGIPFRFALEMINRGWILRNTIIWKKRNPTPESATDRYSNNFEYLFFFSKNKKYYFKQQLVPKKKSSIERSKYSVTKFGGDSNTNMGKLGKGKKGGASQIKINSFSNMKNKKAVWSLSTANFSDAHFATFPISLIKSPIDAGCPKQICKKCNKPITIEYKSEPKGATATDYDDGMGQSRLKWKRKGQVTIIYNSCDCDAGFKKGIVLDPFIGSATTGIEALSQNKNFIGIELNKRYIDIAYKRLSKNNTKYRNEIQDKEIKEKTTRDIFNS